MNPRHQTPGRRIDQGGTDFFLVTREHVMEGEGTLHIQATAWFEPGPIDASFEQGDDEQLWGRLYGTNELRPVPDGALTVDRDVSLRWSRGGPVRMIVNVD